MNLKQNVDLEVNPVSKAFAHALILRLNGDKCKNKKSAKPEKTFV
jgi:hypothetical protein